MHMGGKGLTHGQAAGGETIERPCAVTTMQPSHLAQNGGRQSTVERGYASRCNYVNSHAEQAAFHSLLCLQMHLSRESCVPH